VSWSVLECGRRGPYATAARTLAQEGQCFGKESAAAFPRFQRSQRSFADKLLPSTRPAAGRSRGVSRAWRPPGGELPQHESDTHRQCGLRAAGSSGAAPHTDDAVSDIQD
jgi:hypothetical protein